MGERRTGSAGFLLVAALGGAGVMIVEMAAVRLIAPWFGSSATVWTNVIGVILLALSLGYLLGARLCTGGTPERRLGLALLCGAAFCAVLPGLAAPVCGLFMPRGLALHEAASILGWGSLAATLLLFLPPAACLGCVGPLAVELVQVREASHAGTAGGRVLAASTLGSIVGAFATTHLLIPSFGLRLAFLSAAGLLVVPGIVLWFSASRRVGSGVAALLLLAAGIVFGRGTVPPPPEGFRLCASVASPYQTLRVVESAAGDLRLLQVNEGFDSFQSVWRPEPGLLGESYYYDAFTLPAWWSEARGDWKVLVLGFGAGSVWRVLAGSSPPGARPLVTGIEIDAAAVALGRRWMDLADDGPTLRVLAGRDGRATLNALSERFDLIVLDAYANQIEIPPHLASVECFAQVREHLTEGGWLCANVGGFGFSDPVVSALAATAAEAFAAPVLLLRVPSARNFVLLARRGAAPLAPGDPGWRFEGPVGESLLAPFELPGAWRWVRPGEGRVLTDDHAPLETLQQRSLREGARRLAGRI